jgi:hypothetical protein
MFMDQRIIELALEALERPKAQIDREIAELRSTSSLARRKTQSERMSEYWARKRAESQQLATKKRRRPRTAARKKAQSERMKAYRAKLKAGLQKGRP